MRAAMARAGLAVAALMSSHAFASDFVFLNSNKPFKGFNDATRVERAGLNFGTTRGAQAQIVFRAAGALWGAVLRSEVPIVVNAAFATQGEDSTFTCDDPSGVVLGFARKSGSLINANYPLPRAAYPFALANALSRSNVSSSRDVIYTRFNADLGQPNCKVIASWNMSLDDNGSTLMAVVLHEFGHGLGFASNINKDTGQFFEGASPFDYSLFDVTQSPAVPWLSSGPAGRIPLVTTPNGLVLGGPQVKAEIPRFLGFSPTLDVTLGGADGGTLNYATAAFSGPIQGGGPVARANPSDACADLAAGSLSGKMALIRRGTCAFAEKAARAVDAGAIGILVSNNEAGIFAMAPGRPRINIPAVMIGQGEGAWLETELARDGGTASVRFTLGSARSNANASGAYVYTPSTYAPGSQVSHFNVGSYPRSLLMEPFINPSSRLSMDLTPAAMADMGWPVVNGLTVSVVKALEVPLLQNGDTEYLIAVINRRATAIDSVTLDVSGPGTTKVTKYEGGCTAAPCSLGAMQPGDTQMVVAYLKIGAGLSGDFKVAAKLSPSTANADDNLTASQTLPIASGGDLVVTVTPPAKMDPGTDAVFTTTIVNNGPSTAVQLKATTSLTGSNGAALTLTGDCAGDNPACTLGQLANGDTWSFPTLFSVPKDFGQKVTFSATVSSLTPDPDAGNNTATTQFARGCSTVSGSDVSVWWLAMVLVFALRRRSVS